MANPGLKGPQKSVNDASEGACGPSGGGRSAWSPWTETVVCWYDGTQELPCLHIKSPSNGDDLYV